MRFPEDLTATRQKSDAVAHGLFKLRNGQRVRMPVGFAGVTRYIEFKRR